MNLPQSFQMQVALEGYLGRKLKAQVARSEARAKGAEDRKAKAEAKRKSKNAKRAKWAEAMARGQAMSRIALDAGLPRGFIPATVFGMEVDYTSLSEAAAEPAVTTMVGAAEGGPSGD